MQLAGLIFALDLNARELQGDRPDPDLHPEPGVAARVGVPTFAEGADARPGLVRWAVGDCALHFRKDNARQVMVVVFAAASFGDDIPGALADALLRGFVAKHAEHLEGFGGPSKTLKFERETHAAALDVPVAIAEKKYEERPGSNLGGCTLRSRADSPPTPTRIASGGRRGPG